MTLASESRFGGSFLGTESEIQLELNLDEVKDLKIHQTHPHSSPLQVGYHVRPLASLN